MKNGIIKYSFVLLSILMLYSCSEQERTLSSEKGEMKVSLTAKRYVVADPWLVDIEMEYKGEKLHAEREVMASDITKENVEFEWKGSTMCVVKITERDGSVAVIPIQVHE